MICIHTDSGWEFIYQPAHALLAAMVVEAWRADQRPPRWFETLNAIAQHDNGWQEWESGQRLHANGEPIHFRDTPMEDVVAQAARAVLRAHHQDLYAGLLVSRHISELHEPRRGTADALDELLDEQRELRSRWREALGMAEADETYAYGFLKYGDQLSLILCEGALEKEPAQEIGCVAGVDYCARRGEERAVIVEPWPYDCGAVHVGVDVFHVARRTFASDEALTSMLLETRPERRRWTLVPPGAV